jgi:DNA-binding response OmpR family regulator
MSAILLLEDEPILREEIADFLREIGYGVDAVVSVAEFVDCFDPRRHTIAIVDLVLPDGLGIDLIDRIRAQQLRTGIIVITARSGVRHRVEGLGAGADHYLSKPFDLEELAATVSALSRRLDLGSPTTEWVLDTVRCQLIPPGKPPVPLSGATYIVLKAIVAGAGQRVSRRTIVEALGEDYLQYDLRRLDSQIHYLRKLVVGSCGLEVPIRSFRGQGYQTTELVSLRGRSQ